MTYTRRLRLAKIIVTLCVIFYSVVPVIVDFGTSHVGSSAWSPHARFHLSWSLVTNLMALPVLLFVLWSKLHGTGRSVRLVAFLGLAYSVGFFVASALRPALGSAHSDPGHAHLLLGLEANIVTNAGLVISLFVAVFLSIRRK